MTNTQRAPRDSKSPRGSQQRRHSARDERPIRWSKVMAAQARIASGYYDRDDVKECLIEAIWNELTLN